MSARTQAAARAFQTLDVAQAERLHPVPAVPQRGVRRYGKVSKGCYCLAVRNRPARPHDLHCECTRATHQTVCETALGRPCRVEILETVRRGGRTCHFAVRPA